MTQYQKKAWIRFSGSAASLTVGVLLGSWGAFSICLLFLNIATFLLWRGWGARREGIRIQAEIEWWKKAKNGVEQESLSPCCLLFGETLYQHDEARCTRRKYPMPRVISREELAEIDAAWAEIISHMDDPEYGEEL